MPSKEKEDKFEAPELLPFPTLAKYGEKKTDKNKTKEEIFKEFDKKEKLMKVGGKQF
jgi:hypothetical protein